MKNKSIGLILSELAKEKRFSAVELGNRLGMTRQNVHYTLKHKESMDLAEIQRWAKALEVTSQEILGRVTGDSYNSSAQASVDTTFGAETVEQIKLVIEAEIRKVFDRERAMLENELLEKSNRIHHLEGTVDSLLAMNKELLGKSEGVATAGLDQPFFYGLLTNSLTPNGPQAVTA